MSTHIICFYGELEKIITELSLNTPFYISSAEHIVLDNIDLDKSCIQKNIFFFTYSWKHVVGTHLMCLSEVLLKSIHNIHFGGKMQKYQYNLVEKSGLI